jgi:hypothetical protein
MADRVGIDEGDTIFKVSDAHTITIAYPLSPSAKRVRNKADSDPRPHAAA